MTTETLRDVMNLYRVSTLDALPETCLIVPEFYPKNSLVWTIKRLDMLPIDIRKTACKELREVYLKHDMIAYRDRLNELVGLHGSAKHMFEVRRQQASAETMKAINERIAKLRNKRPTSGSKILDMADGK